MNPNIIPNHIFKNPKNKISPSLRIQVWRSEFNEDEAKCPLYKCTHVINNEVNGFQCGYIVSKYNNGLTTLDNLIPICTECFNKMGSINLDEFNIKLKQEYKLTKKVLNIDC